MELMTGSGFSERHQAFSSAIGDAFRSQIENKNNSRKRLL